MSEESAWGNEKLAAALKLYAITDRTWMGNRTLTECVRQAIDGGATMIQLREKEASRIQKGLFGRVVFEECRKAGVPFIINDDVDLAISLGADGVHVGQDDASCKEARAALGQRAIVGVSAHSVEEALAAQRDGASYLGVGDVFGTSTKPDAKPLGLAELKSICDAVDIPVVAIGGVNAHTIPELKGSGAAGVAVVSSLFSASDICKQAEKLSAVVKETLV